MKRAQNQRGFVIGIVIAVIFIAGVVIFAMNQLMRERAKFSSVYEKRLKMKYCAESGIEKAFHMLKAGDFASRFYSGSSEGNVEGTIAGMNFKALCKDDTTVPNTVLITATAYLGKETLTIEAQAEYVYNEELLAKTVLFTKFAEYRTWKLKYK